MDHKPRIYLMIIFLVIASLACGFSDLTGQVTSTTDPGALDTAVARSLVETASIQTAVAQGVSSVIAPTQGGGSAGGPTVQSQSSLTPSLTVSPTSGKAMVSVSNATNCRSGPGTVYDWLGALNPGLEVEILGKDPSNSSYFIKNPTNPSGFCWIWNTYATVTGDLAAVPVYTPMPTPTLAKTATLTTVPTNITISLSNLVTCGNYFMEFEIKNSGSMILQSWQIELTDLSTAITKVNQSNSFYSYVGCVQSQVQDDLATGESGKLVGGGFSTSPFGHNFEAIIKLCSAEGLGGTCITKSIPFPIN